MKKLLSILTISLIAFGCKKSDTSPNQCETNKTGSLTISNNSNDTYDIYIDDIYKISIPANSVTKPITVNEGNNITLYAEQADGYTFYPTTKTGTFNIVRCSDYSWQIP